MSLLMDALRKAEEAKKKAELKSKSDAAQVKRSQPRDDAGLDIEIEFDAPAAASTPFEENSDTLSAIDEFETSNDEQEQNPDAGLDQLTFDESVEDILAEDNRTEDEFLPESDDGEIGTEEAVADRPDAQALDLHSPPVYSTQASDTEIANEQPFTNDQPEVIEYEAAAPDSVESERADLDRDTPDSTDDHSLNFNPLTDRNDAKADAIVPVSQGMAADSESEPAREQDAPQEMDERAAAPVAGATSVPAQSKPRVEPSPVVSIDQADDEIDADTEEQDRRSAQSVFAAKRRSPLQKNLQLTAFSIAAVLVVAIGIYFYINLRTTSGITISNVDLNYQQAQPDFAEFEPVQSGADLTTSAGLADDIDDSRVDVDSSPGQPAVNNVTSSSVPGTVDIDTAVTTGNGNVVTDSSSLTDIVSPPTVPQDVPAPTSSAATASANPEANVADVPMPDNAIASNRIDTVVGLIPDLDADNDIASDNVSNISNANNTNDNINDSVMQTAASAGSLQPEQIEPVTLINFSRSVTPPTRNPVLENAYAAYQEGNLDQAERLYQEVLATAPLNRNALLGVASIAANRQDTVTALELYSRLLARNPNDPVARAGLLDIMPRGSLREQETELKRLRNENPDIAPLAYALGNFMASQQRWSEAQQAYFSALQLAKNDALGGAVNPDYAFNLAVSLEHLGQPRPASNYYQEALALAEVHPAGFDLTIARQRLSSVESARNE